jgi:hypothetical protein
VDGTTLFFSSVRMWKTKQKGKIIKEERERKLFLFSRV